MTAKIYLPTKNPMQSGKSKTSWVLEYKQVNKSSVDKLMGWNGSSDMKQEIKLKFDSKEAAIAYAHKNNMQFELLEPKQSKVKLQSYADNFTN